MPRLENPVHGCGGLEEGSVVPPRAQAGVALPVITRAGRLRRPSVAHSAWSVAFVVAAIYAVWLAHVLPASHGGLDFIRIGRHFIGRSHASPVITVDPVYYRRFAQVNGYDGQFCYYIALDPLHARPYVDTPAYRYTRILYPLAARLVALGQPALIPYALIAVNWLALVGGTLAVAAWLRRRRRSPWFALLYGLYPGLFLSMQRDLTEPLSYALVALAIYLFDTGGRRAVLWSGLAFALAILTREVAAIFALVYGLSLLAGKQASWQRRVGRAALLLGLAGIPLLLYKGVLFLWLGSSGVPPELTPLRIPFQGIITYWPWRTQQIEMALTVVLPALICAAMGLWALAKRAGTVEVWALLANVELCVVTLSPYSYHQEYTTLRVTAGVVLAALYCLPSVDRANRRNRLWLWISGALWLSFLPGLLLSRLA